MAARSAAPGVTVRCVRAPDAARARGARSGVLLLGRRKRGRRFAPRSVPQVPDGEPCDGADAQARRREQGQEQRVARVARRDRAQAVHGRVRRYVARAPPRVGVGGTLQPLQFRGVDQLLHVRVDIREGERVAAQDDVRKDPGAHAADGAGSFFSSSNRPPHRRSSSPSAGAAPCATDRPAAFRAPRAPWGCGATRAAGAPGTSGGRGCPGRTAWRAAPLWPRRPCAARRRTGRGTCRRGRPGCRARCAADAPAPDGRRRP